MYLAASCSVGVGVFLIFFFDMYRRIIEHGLGVTIYRVHVQRFSLEIVLNAISLSFLNPMSIEPK